LCGHPTDVEGARPCPREAGHGGDHYWWIPFEAFDRCWKVVVYSGPPKERVRRCRGTFVSEPDGFDVLWLLQLISRLREREREMQRG
jgi:hypothetical protein